MVLSLPVLSRELPVHIFQVSRNEREIQAFLSLLKQKNTTVGHFVRVKTEKN